MNLVIPDGGSNLNLILEEVEKAYITAALEQCLNNKAQAAMLLGLNRSTFMMKLKKYGYHPESEDIGKDTRSFDVDTN